MKNLLYDYMNWPLIEGVMYSDIDNPQDVLGPHIVNDGLLVCTFIPDAVSVSLKVMPEGECYQMFEMDKSFFAVLLPDKKPIKYTYISTYENGNSVETYDSYSYQPSIPIEELRRFNLGINYEIYRFLGSHVEIRDGLKGVRFAVWAPEAVRVSVVGDFNFWDGRRHQMVRRENTGVFELFIPDIDEAIVYKYEIKKKGNMLVLKSDPYAFAAEVRPNTASIVKTITNYTWNDKEWIENREQANGLDTPISIYEIHIGSWKRPVEGDKDSFYNYRDIANMLAIYCKTMGYTHVELMPVMEHPLDASWGYQVTGYYAPTSRYGNPEDFMYFIDHLHENGIGVILDWVPAHFPKDLHGLSEFDGSCLYEHKDPRKGQHPHWGTLIYNYARPEVSNFLIANALFWTEVYHVDGIRMDAVASMLYLDYGKKDGEWVANMYGGNENLDAIEFIKHLNSIYKKRNKGTLLIAEESTAWPQVTGALEEGGLGFDLKWNMGWMNDYINYIKTDPYFRHSMLGELTFSMIYNYSEKFILPFSHDEVVHGKSAMIGKMPGDSEEKKMSQLRLSYGYMIAHPGKKLLFMGQELGGYNEWNEDNQIEWSLLEYESHKKLQEFVKVLNNLYKNEPALYEQDFVSEGFEWINNISADESIISFIRRGNDEDDMVIVVCNFDTIKRPLYQIGVPVAGKYKEILNSDSTKYGGEGFGNPRLVQSAKKECDQRPDSIKINVPALSIIVLKHTKEEKKLTDNITVKSQKKENNPPKKPGRKPASVAVKGAIEAENAALSTGTKKTGKRS